MAEKQFLEPIHGPMSFENTPEHQRPYELDPDWLGHTQYGPIRLTERHTSDVNKTISCMTLCSYTRRYSCMLYMHVASDSKLQLCAVRWLSDVMNRLIILSYFYCVLPFVFALRACWSYASLIDLYTVLARDQVWPFDLLTWRWRSPSK